MRIKKLEIVGFKSFKDRTVIHFDEGITGIVGPNGCGKSNIVDALVWVMGEMSAKHLRGSSMEDVIFAGAEGYAPLGMAEVSLTLENDGGPFPAKYMRHSEVMVTRRLHRSGESEYLINKEAARLKDIQEIFMDTGAGSKGFSIIEQGAIGKIITAKPEDRRVLIEEAAGITKFKVRKRESQRKLQGTEQNLVRLQDIIGEQKRQLDSLQRQAQRAERYRAIKNEMQDKELWLSAKKYLQIHEDAAQAQTVFDEARELEAVASSDLSQWEADLESRKLQLVEREKQVEEKQSLNQQILERVQALEFTIRELSFEIEQARRNKEMTGSILQQNEARKVALSRELEQLTERLSEVKVQAESMGSKYQEKQQHFQSVQSRIQQIDEELSQSRREMLTVSQSESHVEARLMSLDSQIEGQQERLESSREVLLELEGQHQEFTERRRKLFNDLEKERQLQLDIMRDVEGFEANLDSLKSQFESRTKEVEEFKDSLNEVSSRLYGLENLHANFEGFQEGVKNIMMWQRRRQQESEGLRAADASHEGSALAFQPVAELVEVPAEYEMAMEAALGQRLQVLLGPSSDKVLDAVDHLKENKQGRSSFMAIDLLGEAKTSPTSEVAKEEGVRALLKDIVQVPETHRQQVAYILKDVVVVDSIRSALRLRSTYSGFSFVTLEGDTLSPDGVLTGGSPESAESGVLKRRREIKELSQKREEWAGKLSLAQLSLKKLEGQIKSLTEDLEKARQAKSEKEFLLSTLKRDLERAEVELNNSTKAIERQGAEVDKLDGQMQRLSSEAEELRDRLTELKEKKLGLEASVESLTAEYQTSRQGFDQLQQEVTGLQVNAAAKKQELEGLNHQVQMMERSLGEINEQLSQMSEESQKSTESLSTNQVVIEERRVELESLIGQSHEAKKIVAEVRDLYEQELQAHRELESKVSKALHGINDHKSRMSEAQLKLEQLKMKEQYLLDQINERYMVNLSEVAERYKDVECDFAQTEKEVEELKTKLSRIGDVNLSAIQEYDELVHRYEFLSQQYKDLTEAKEQLRKVIDRINRICSKRFKETFEQVNERFIKVFPVLFGGGEAHLILVEDPEKDEMGVDIVAKPPGKKLQSVSLLSGGEKALTAVSLIFSIFLVKPSPFCLLDEVDAPLDDANVFRFNDLVKEMAKRSQMIVVTHNKYTMKVNNKLYGVTMEEKGVSKMVSVSLAEAEKVAAS